jgi:quinol monooxygenase YgiN
MPPVPWRTLASPDPNREFLALLSYLPLESHWRILPFLIYTAQITRQLAATKGVLGYSLLARPLSKRFWTLSAWESEDALQTFVHQSPHGRVMNALAPHMQQTQFLRWSVKGAQLPLSWDDALRRFAEHRPPQAHGTGARTS